MKHLLKICCVLLLFSCEKEIEYKGEGKEPVLVLNGILENHEKMEIKLSRSVFFLSNNQDNSKVAITDATVIITNLSNGNAYSLTHSNDGIYNNAELVLPNTTYRIEISHPKYKSISSEITTVSDPKILDIDTSTVALDSWGNVTHPINYKFIDPIGENFYTVSGDILYEITHLFADSTVNYLDSSLVSCYINSTDYIINYTEDGLFFNDETFEGKPKSFLVQFSEYSYFELSTKRVISYRAKLTSVSKDLYKYFISKPKNNPSDPFSDPSNVHSNVQNGLGIFGSISSHEFVK